MLRAAEKQQLTENYNKNRHSKIKTVLYGKAER
jgi:hypothetical protein